MRAWAAVVLGVICAAASRAQEGSGLSALAAVRARGVIEVALYEEYPPFSFRGADAPAAGIDVDIARTMADRLGLKLRVRLFPAGDTVSEDLRNVVWKGHYLAGGVADFMLHAGCDPQFAAKEPNVFLFSPYFHDFIALAYQPERIPHVDSPLALTEHQIAIEGGTLSDYYMSSAFGGALRTHAVRKLSLEEAVDAFGRGEVDGVMGPRGELQGLLFGRKVGKVSFHAQNAVGSLHMAWDVGVAVKRSGEDTSLRDALADALGRAVGDGTVRRIFERHGVEYASPDSISPPVTGGQTSGR